MSKKDLIRKLRAKFPSTNKNKKIAENVKVSKSLGLHLCALATHKEAAELADYIRFHILPGIPQGGRGTYYKAFQDLIRDLRLMMTTDDTNRSLFIMKGNSKLPFVTWSEAPIVTCPGRGPCADYCYTFTGWRSPQALIRQIYNTMIIRLRPDIVAKHYQAIPAGAIVRLYVDGDFSNTGILDFWMELIASRPEVLAYGYSKSWALFMAHGRPFPSNYMLNVSSGSKYGQDLETALNGLRRADGSPLVRGLFAAVSIDMTGIDSKTRYDNPLYHKRVREAILAEYGVVGWSCTGKCGTCNKGQHACNSDRFQGVIIGIGIH